MVVAGFVVPLSSLQYPEEDDKKKKIVPFFGR
jgi:hypothetical protein